MEEKFVAAWEENRVKAEKLGVRMRPLDVNGAKRILSGTRLSDGFSLLAQKSALKLSLEALAVDFESTTSTISSHRRCACLV